MPWLEVVGSVAGDALMGELAGAAIGDAALGGALGGGMDAFLSGTGTELMGVPGAGYTLAGGAAGAAPTNWMSYLNSPLASAGVSSAAGLLGANQTSQAARNAAALQAQAGQTATQLQARMYQDQLGRTEPFYQAGVNALPAYTQGVMPGGNLVRPFAESDFKADPGYGFRIKEGMQALDRTAAARGGLLSGATLKGAERFNQDLASNEYSNAYNRYIGNQATQRNALAGLTGFGPTAATTMGQAGNTYATNAGNIGMGTATTMANADLTGAAARQSAYGGAGGAFALSLIHI
jgi:hypothetical protein